MRNTVQKYLSIAEAEANQHVMSANGEKGRSFGADGFLDRSMYFTDPPGGGGNPANFYQSSFGADGEQAVQAPATLSQPYIVTVSNTSAARVQGFEIWGANIYLGNTFSGGSLTISGVTISSAMPAPVTYYTMLQQSLTNNFTIGKTYLRSVSGTAAQVFNALTVKTYDANGNFAGKLLPSPLSPMQYQSGAYENNMPYRIDGFTTVSIDIEASVVFQIYFYPSYTINLARGLGDRPIGAGFAAPQINPVQPVKVLGNNQ